MAQAAITDTRSKFIAQLLAPVGTPAENRRFLAGLRREAEQAWSLVYHRFYAADCYRHYCGHLRRAAEIEQRRLDVPEKAQEEQALLVMLEAVDSMMHVPAPTIGALRLKEKLRGFRGGEEHWEAVIAADVARLMEKK